jgi:hypothetical protein
MNSRLCSENGSYEYKRRVLPNRWWFIKDVNSGLSDCKSRILPTLSCDLVKTGTGTSQRKSGHLFYSVPTISIFSYPSEEIAMRNLCVCACLCLFAQEMENYLFEDLNLSKYTISVRIFHKQRGSLKLPRKRWLDDAENDLKKMNVRNRRETAMD